VNGTLVYNGPNGGDRLEQDTTCTYSQTYTYISHGLRSEGSSGNPKTVTAQYPCETKVCLFAYPNTSCDNDGTCRESGTKSVRIEPCDTTYSPIRQNAEYTCPILRAADRIGSITRVNNYVTIHKGNLCGAENYMCQLACLGSGGIAKVALSPLSNDLGLIAGPKVWYSATSYSAPDLRTSRTVLVGTSLKNLLKEGKNTIETRTLVGGTGDTRIEFTVQTSCDSWDDGCSSLGMFVETATP